MRFLIVFAAACASNGSTMSGAGSFSPDDTISAVVTDSGNSSARIEIASTDHLCSDVSASPPIDRKLQRLFQIDLADVAGSDTAAPTAPGAYTVYPDSGSRPTKSASIVSMTLDDTCQPDSTSTSGQSGTVTLSTISGGTFSGSYDIVLKSGDHITGTFSPSSCAALATATTSGEHRCQ